jgi:hypothetical protein
MSRRQLEEYRNRRGRQAEEEEEDIQYSTASPYNPYDYEDPIVHRGRTSARNAATARSKRSRSRDSEGIVEENVPPKEVKTIINKLQTLTSHLHQPKTGIEDIESPIKKSNESYVPPPLIITEYTSGTRIKMLELRNVILKSLKNLQRKRALMDIIGTQILDSDNDLKKVDNLKWPRTAIYFFSEDYDIKEFTDNISYLWAWLKDYPDIREWIRNLQNNASEITKSDFQVEDITKNIDSYQKIITKIRHTLSNAKLVVEEDKLNVVQQKLYNKILSGTNVAKGASLFTNIYEYINNFLGISISNTRLESLEQLIINYMITAFSIIILIILIPNKISSIIPFLNDIRPFFNSIIVINFSEILASFIGEFLNRTVGLPYYVFKGCEIAGECKKQLTKHIDYVSEHIDIVYNNIQQIINLYYQPNIETAELVIYDMQNLYDLTHEEERQKKGAEKTAHEMDIEQEEAESVFKSLAKGGKPKTKKTKKNKSKTLKKLLR